MPNQQPQSYPADFQDEVSASRRIPKKRKQPDSEQSETQHNVRAPRAKRDGKRYEVQDDFQSWLPWVGAGILGFLLAKFATRS